MSLESKAYVLETMRRSGKLAAKDLQERSVNMTGTELYEEEDFIPSFKAAVAKMNMLERKAGQTDGFVCKSSAGRVVRLIQNYDSTVFTAEPEELPAQYRFVWSKDPKYALPFVALATSPYDIGDCCLNEAGEPKRSTINTNTWSPDTNPEFWESVEL